MKVLLSSSSYELTVKGSRFLSEVIPVQSAQEARQTLLLQKQKYADATHVVHAFVCGLKGETCGMSDDGEPSGTAGRPVLDVLKGSGITNILLTVTRWFGGTLLGTGGLVHAYSDSARLVLEGCSAEEYVQKTELSFCCDYKVYEIVKRLCDEYHIEILSETFSDNVCLSLRIYESERERFCSYLTDISRGAVNFGR